MATKKVTPTNPEAKSEARADDKAASRKTTGMKFPRKTGRTTAGRKPPG